MITFFVPGLPVPKGSWRSFPVKGSKRRVFVADNAEQLKPWVESIQWSARAAINGKPHDGPVAYRFDFYFPRPKAHFTKTGRRSAQYTDVHAVKPDLDKLKRAVFDALEKIVYTNDSRLCRDRGSEKYYVPEGGRIGVRITLWLLDRQGNAVGMQNAE